MVFEDDLKKAEGKKRRFGWVFRLFFILCFLFVAGLGVMSTLGGQRDSLRVAAEQYLTSITGLQATIETLNYMAFFPHITADMEGIVFKSFETDERMAEIDEIYFSMKFFNIFFSPGRLNDLRIENLTARKGVWTKRALNFRKIAMEDKAYEGKPALVIEGQYGEDPVAVYIGLQKQRKLGKHPSFKLGDDNTFSMKIGELEAKGRVSKSRRGGLDFDIESLGVPGKVMSGNLLARYASGKLALDGTLARGNSRVELDLDFKQGVSGTIYSPVFDLADLAGEPSIGKLITALQALVKDPAVPQKEIKAEDYNFNVEVKLVNIQGNGVTLGHLDFPVKTTDGTTNIGPFNGVFSGGKFSGGMQFMAKESPATLKIKLGMNDWQYGQVQKAFYGRENVQGSADIYVEAEGSGKYYADILKTLKGKAILLGGEGKFASATLNVWGAGLVNAIIPDLDPESETKLNCMLAAFKIEEGIAMTHTVFVDTKRVTVVGSGEIDIPEGKIDLKLTPESKETTILDVAPSVRIKGPVFKPSIGPDTVSVLGKIGGLLLGTVNPAFLTLSLTDIGASDDHPCRKFIKEE